MTRKESISEISNIIFELGFEDTSSTGKRVEALNMAIKALSAKPCEDCIEIPKGATNGDMIQAIFGFQPRKNTCILPKEYCNGNPAECDGCRFNDFWGSPYREEQKMTREERLDWLCRLRGQLIYFDMPDHWRTNFTHALSDEINDLQQEPREDRIIDEHYWKGFNSGIRTEKFRESKRELCNDAISRQAVVDVLKKNGVHFCDMVNITSDLKELPSVTPKPKIGYWIKSSNGMFAECSDCGKHGEYGLLKQYKYCPNCGAKMESEG